jgi:hypothetical protein
MNKTMFSLLLLALAPAAASAHEGFYVGGGFGRSDYSDTLYRQITTAYNGSPDYSVGSANLKDHSDNAWKLTVGYDFLPWLGAEFAWTDAGKANSAYRLEPKPLLNTGPVTARGHYELDGASLALVGKWPIGDAFEISVRGGVVASRLDYSEHGQDVPGQFYDFDAHTDSSTNGIAGLGLAWRVGPQWDVRLDWDRWFDVGSSYRLNERDNGRFGNVDLYTVNVLYHFDR